MSALIPAAEAIQNALQHVPSGHIDRAAVSELAKHAGHAVTETANTVKNAVWTDAIQDSVRAAKEGLPQAAGNIKQHAANWLQSLPAPPNPVKWFQHEASPQVIADHAKQLSTQAQETITHHANGLKAGFGALSEKISSAIPGTIKNSFKAAQEVLPQLPGNVSNNVSEWWDKMPHYKVVLENTNAQPLSSTLNATPGINPLSSTNLKV